MSDRNDTHVTFEGSKIKILTNSSNQAEWLHDLENFAADQSVWPITFGAEEHLDKPRQPHSIDVFKHHEWLKAQAYNEDGSIKAQLEDGGKLRLYTKEELDNAIKQDLERMDRENRRPFEEFKFYHDEWKAQQTKLAWAKKVLLPSISPIIRDLIRDHVNGTFRQILHTIQSIVKADPVQNGRRLPQAGPASTKQRLYQELAEEWYNHRTGVTGYLQNLKRIRAELHAAGDLIPEPFFIHRVLSALPVSWDNFKDRYDTDVSMGVMKDDLDTLIMATLNKEASMKSATMEVNSVEAESDKSQNNNSGAASRCYGQRRLSRMAHSEAAKVDPEDNRGEARFVRGGFGGLRKAGIADDSGSDVGPKQESDLDGMDHSTGHSAWPPFFGQSDRYSTAETASIFAKPRARYSFQF